MKRRDWLWIIVFALAIIGMVILSVIIKIKVYTWLGKWLGL